MTDFPTSVHTASPEPATADPGMEAAVRMLEDLLEASGEASKALHNAEYLAGVYGKGRTAEQFRFAREQLDAALTALAEAESAKRSG